MCGYDGSPDAVRAAHFAARLAVAVGAALRVVCVLDDGTRAGVDLPSEDELQEAAADAVPEGSTLVVERDWRRGEPAEELEGVAVAVDAPAIVVGTRGRGPLRAVLLGSTSRRVLHAARRPVVLVPRGAGG